MSDWDFVSNRRLEAGTPDGRPDPGPAPAYPPTPSETPESPPPGIPAPDPGQIPEPGRQAPADIPTTPIEIPTPTRTP